MKSRQNRFSRHYQEALRAHLKQRGKASLESAVGLGSQALEAGLLTLDLAKLHEGTLVMELLPTYPAGRRAAVIKRAGIFFAAAIAPENAGSIALEAARLKAIIETLSDRTVELAAANQLLSLEIVRREEVEASLKQSEQHHLKSLEASDHLKEQLRGLSRQLLSAQEDERKKISRELHDVIAQELMSINVRLAALKTATGINIQGMERNIALTQEMVTKAAATVYQFALELRPSVLDDLGLIPALHSFMDDFTKRTGVRSYLTAFDGVENLNPERRTVIYRVAQEALTNVACHAKASRVEVIIRKQAKSVRLEVSDDGKSFEVDTIMGAGGNKRLGLLGMRERVEMIGGEFHIESALGKGTTITAQIPVTKATGKQWALQAGKIKPKTS